MRSLQTGSERTTEGSICLILISRSQASKFSCPIHLLVQVFKSMDSGKYSNLKNSSIVSEYCFGHNSNALADLNRAASMRKNVATVLRGVKINLQFSWIRSMVRMLPARLAGRWVPQGIQDMIQLRKVRDILLLK